MDTLQATAPASASRPCGPRHRTDRGRPHTGPADQAVPGQPLLHDVRCTIITRVYTSGGLVGEAYNGDTDAEQAWIVKIITDEIVPQPARPLGPEHRGLLGGDAARRPTTSCGTARSRCRRWPASTARSGTCSARPSACRCTSSGVATGTGCRRSASAATTATTRPTWPARSSTYLGARLRGLQVQGRSAGRREQDARRTSSPARPRATTSC